MCFDEKGHELSKTPLTKGKRDDILQKPRERRTHESPRKIFLEKLKKVLKKGLTKGTEVCIIEKLSDAGDGSDGHRSLKIEQQNFEH